MVKKLDCNQLGKGVRKGEELKTFRYASTAAIRDYIIARDIIPNNFKVIIKRSVIFIRS